MDTVTHRAQLVLALRRARFGRVRLACRAFGAWARSGANPLTAFRAAARAWSNA